LLDEVFDPFSLYNYCSPKLGEHFFAGVAQLVEQLIRNQQVSGSSPLAGLKINNLARSMPAFFVLVTSTTEEAGPAPGESLLRSKSCAAEDVWWLLR
jgi:hypothetical protein